MKKVSFSQDERRYISNKYGFDSNVFLSKLRRDVVDDWFYKSTDCFNPFEENLPLNDIKMKEISKGYAWEFPKFISVKGFYRDKKTSENKWLSFPVENELIGFPKINTIRINWEGAAKKKLLQEFFRKSQVFFFFEKHLCRIGTEFYVDENQIEGEVEITKFDISYYHSSVDEHIGIVRPNFVQEFREVEFT